MRKTIKLFSLLAMFGLAVAVSPVLAQTAAAPAAATPTAVPTPAVTVDGMVDAYYAYNFTDPGSFSNGGYYFYNNQANSFTMGLAEVKATATQGQGSAHIVLAYGQEVPLALIPSGIDVLQAYVSYNPGQVTINAGRFVTWMGYEVIEETSNWNYSHSLLFGALPFWHTGVSVNYAPSTIFNATIYDVDDPWQSTVAGIQGKDLGLEAAITPNSIWGITLNGIMGPVAGTPSQNSIVGEAIVTYKPSAWNFALDAQMGTATAPSGAKSPSYVGIALYGKYQIQSDWSAALRLEYVDDSYNTYGFMANPELPGKAFTGDEGTLTIEHDFTPNLISRAEARLDMANYNSAAADIFPTNAAPSSSNLTGTLSMAYTF